MTKTAFLFLFLSSALFANAIGIVHKVDGIVKVKHASSIKKSKLKKGDLIQEGDIVSTFRKSHAVLKLQDGSNVVVGPKSVISFENALAFAQNEGKIYYKITSKDLKNKLKIKTNFAIIGIKGTTFIVGADDNSSFVALKEGLIGIASIKEEFRLYKQKVMSEYEAYVRKQKEGFEKFKKAQEEYVVTQTKEFDLEAGHVVSFEQNKAVEKPLKTKEEFAAFEKLLK